MGGKRVLYEEYEPDEYRVKLSADESYSMVDMINVYGGMGRSMYFIVGYQEDGLRILFCEAVFTGDMIDLNYYGVVKSIDVKHSRVMVPDAAGRFTNIYEIKTTYFTHSENNYIYSYDLCYMANGKKFITYRMHEDADSLDKEAGMDLIAEPGRRAELLS